MRASEFNQMIGTTLEAILCRVGFKRVGQCFVREWDRSQLVLLRFGGSKFASLCQFTRFMLCFRHTFLRDLNETVPASFPENGHAYPFKVKPSDLLSRPVSKWRYQFKLNPDDYDEIEYGSSQDAESVLLRLGETVATKGVEWGAIFSEEFALQLLTAHGSNAWCEKLWLADYFAQKRKVLV